MDKETFEKYKNQLLKKAANIRREKEEEYHSTTDIIGSFRRIAAFRNKETAQSIVDLAAKQLVSISDMVDDEEGYPIEVWEEKIANSLNYLMKLYACIREEKEV